MTYNISWNYFYPAPVKLVDSVSACLYFHFFSNEFLFNRIGLNLVYPMGSIRAQNLQSISKKCQQVVFYNILNQDLNSEYAEVINWIDVTST